MKRDCIGAHIGYFNAGTLSPKFVKANNKVNYSTMERSFITLEINCCLPLFKLRNVLISRRSSSVNPSAGLNSVNSPPSSIHTGLAFKALLIEIKASAEGLEIPLSHWLTDVLLVSGQRRTNSADFISLSSIAYWILSPTAILLVSTMFGILNIVEFV